MQASANALRRVWHALGPGLVTGAADDDPSGIATYSQAGAQFGFALTWTMLLTLPFMAAIQIISACIGWETGAGLARNIKRELPAVVLYALVALLAVANTINIAADLAAMGETGLSDRGGVDPVSSLCRLSETADAGAAGVRRGSLQRAYQLGRSIEGSDSFRRSRLITSFCS